MGIRYGVVLAVAALLLAGTTLIGCNREVRPPVDKASNLEKLVVIGQTLEQVQDMMTDRLRTRVMLYPAEMVEQKASGSWSFKAVEGGISGDTDAPFVVLILYPDRQGDKYYAVFFEDDAVIDSEWFPSSSAEMISKLLGNRLSTGQ